MNFRKELSKELGLGAIAENTMLNDYVKACEAIAVRYHESKVEKFRLAAVVGRSEQLHCKHEHIESSDGCDECMDCGARNY